MKNVTISLDDETHRRARIRAAELGTSLSGLVKQYLSELASDGGSGLAQAGVREMPSSFHALPAAASKPSPRKLDSLKGLIHVPDDFDGWPDDMLDAFEAPIGPEQGRR